jgi:glycosyltransferase involved in cell wall biosynthesis
MHIVYLHQYFNTPAMSGSTRSYEIARRLVSAGHRVSVVTSSRISDDRKGWVQSNESGIDVHWLAVPYSNRMAYGERISAFLRFAFGAARRAASLRGDVVFATSTPLTIAIPGVFAARKLKVPMVFEVRDLWPEVPIAIGALRNPLFKKCAKWLESWAYQNSEAVIALSPGMRDGVVRAGYDPRRVAVIPNSCDNQDFAVSTARRDAWRARRSWLGDRILITYPGTFGRINGVGYLVGVAAKLKQFSPDIRILLIGDGVEKEGVIRLAEEAGVLGVNLFVEDMAPKAEMPDVFAGSDMICSLVVDVPELFANSANKVFDALAAGRPLLINHGGWQAEFIKSSNCGVVTWGMSTEEAARSIADALNDIGWRTRAGDASRMLALSCFDRDRLVVQFSEILLAAQERKGWMASVIAPGDFSTR